MDIDFTSCIEHDHYEHLNIYGPNNVGKTSYLTALRKYHSGEGGNDPVDDHDRHFVIFLDFSDFVAIAYIDAVNYFRKKMSELYLLMYEKVKEELHYFETLADYLDMIEGVSDAETIKKSLLKMVRLVRYGRKSCEHFYRPVLLIDEVSRPLLYAAKYGYLNEMTEFYDTFLEIDHDEMTAGIITTSYAPPNTGVHYGLKYINDVPVNRYEPMKAIGKLNGIKLVEPQGEGGYWDGGRYFKDMITLGECFDRLIEDKAFSETALSRYEIELSQEVCVFINTKRIWIAKEQYLYEEAEKKRREREKLEFKQPLASGFDIPSAFAGTRELDMKVGNCYGSNLPNIVLRELYRIYGKEISRQDVYDNIQFMGGHYENVDEIRSTVEKLKEYANSGKGFYRCWIDVNDSYWAKFDLERFENDRGYGDMALVKTYISVSKSSEVLRVFEDVVRFLIDNGGHLFHAKISLKHRVDHICLWVAREDFFILEKYVEKYDEILEKTLYFVAYRGKLGITREFHSWCSHNGFISELIKTYLESVDSEDEINVINMLSYFVKAWNGDLEEDNSFSKNYRESNAQELIVLLESMNIILGNSTLDDDNILLNGDGKMWCALGESKNWYQVGIKFKELERERLRGKVT